MHSFTAVIAASALVSTTYGSPIVARSTCGSAAAGSGSQTPLSQPMGITTAAQCQAQCEANNSCQSFVFGMVSNAIKCMLYAVPASSIPKQSSTNLVTFDKACTSVPSVVPTKPNPTGAQSPRLAVRATCGSAPAGSGSNTPISQPTGTTTASACLTQCNGNPSCLSFVFGMVDNVDKCMLFSVAAASVPKQSSTNLVAFDKACTSVPAVVPTSSNPTGANTGSGSNTGAGQTGSNTGSNPGAPAGNGGQKQHKRATCGVIPAGPTGTSMPISVPSGISDVTTCLAACKANASCKSFEFAKETSQGANICKLFSVAAASVPAPQSEQTFAVYDVGCSI